MGLFLWRRMNNIKLKHEWTIAVAEVIGDDTISKRVRGMRIKALSTMCDRLYVYLKERFMPELIQIIFEKRKAFILQATTQKEIDQIMDFPKVYYNGNEIVPANPYVIPEEELIMWSLIFLRAPLRSEAYARNAKLFRKVFPEKYEEIFGNI